MSLTVSWTTISATTATEERKRTTPLATKRWSPVGIEHLHFNHLAVQLTSIHVFQRLLRVPQLFIFHVRERAVEVVMVRVHWHDYFLQLAKLAENLLHMVFGDVLREMKDMQLRNGRRF